MEEKVYYQGAGIYKVVKGDSWVFVHGNSFIPRVGHPIITGTGTLQNTLDTTNDILQESQDCIVQHYQSRTNEDLLKELEKFDKALKNTDELIATGFKEDKEDEIRIL